MWYVQYCAYGSRSAPAVCVQPANVTIGNDFAQCSHGFCNATLSALNVVSPCTILSAETQVSQAGARVLATDFGEFSSAPLITSQVNSTTSISITITARIESADETPLQNGGDMYCGAYRTATLPSVPNLKSLNWVGKIDAATQQAEVTIGDLSGATNYYVFCMTLSSDGIDMTYDTVVSTSQRFNAEAYGPSFATSAWKIRTSCCKIIDVTVTGATFIEGLLYSRVIRVELGTEPSQDFTLTLGITNVTGGAISDEKFISPTTMSFAPDGALIKFASLYMNDLALADRTTPTSGNLSVTLAGTENEFAISYRGEVDALPPVIALQPNTVTVPPPTITSANFTRDGTSILVTFSADTDRGTITAGLSSATDGQRQVGTSDSFACKYLFAYTFSGSAAASSTCQWTTPSSITITFSGTDRLVPHTNTVDSRLELVNDAGIRASCVRPTSECENWETVVTGPLTLIQILAPQNAIVPEVFLVAATDIGSCDDYVGSWSNSRGSGAQRWFLKTVSVTGSVLNSEGTGRVALTGSEHNVSVYTSEENNKNPTGGSIPTTAWEGNSWAIPADLISVGTYWTVQVTLTNFLGKSSTASTSVTRVENQGIPIVTVNSPEIRRMTRQEELNLKAEASYKVCDGAIFTSGLTFSWKLYLSTDLLTPLDVSSISPDTTVLKVSQNTLTTSTRSTNIEYRAVVTVTRTETGFTAQKTVKIIVVPGKLVMKLPAGLDRTVPPSSSLLVDASASYDEDQGDATGVYTTGLSAGLSYSWSCAAVRPVRPSCEAFTNAAAFEGANSSSLAIAVPNSNAYTGYVYQFTVTIGSSVQPYDSTGALRTATSNVRVTILESEAATVEIIDPSVAYPTLNLRYDKLRLDKSLYISARITTSRSVETVWSLDNSSVTIAQLSPRSPVSSNLESRGAGTSQTFFVNLVLSAAILSPGQYYKFRLEATTDNTTTGGVQRNSVTSYAVVEVYTNRPPVPGTISVTPATGTEMITQFALLLDSWSDTEEDFPIVYGFRYISDENTAWSSDLNLDYSDAVGDDTYTSVGTQKSTENYLSTPLPAGVTTNNFTRILVGFVYDSFGAVTTLGMPVTVNIQSANNASDALTSLESIVASASSGVESGTFTSSEAEEAKKTIESAVSVLNGADCSKAPDCAALNRESCQVVPNTCGVCLTTHLYGQEGNANSPCGSSAFPAAKNQTCPGEAKTGSNGCGDSGACVYTDELTGLVTSTCLVGSRCSAQCTCDPGYNGPACSLTDADFAQITLLRSNMITNYYSIWQSTADSDPEVASAYVVALYRLMIVTDQVNPAARSVVASFANAIVTQAIAAKGSRGYFFAGTSFAFISQYLQVQTAVDKSSHITWVSIKRDMAWHCIVTYLFYSLF
jgi:hypothetical protein